MCTTTTQVTSTSVSPKRPQMGGLIDTQDGKEARTGGNQTKVGRHLTLQHSKFHLQLRFVWTVPRQLWLWSNTPKDFMLKKWQSTNIMEILISSARCPRNTFKSINLTWYHTDMILLFQLRWFHCLQPLSKALSQQDKKKMPNLMYNTMSMMYRMTKRQWSVFLTHSTPNCARR